MSQLSLFDAPTIFDRWEKHRGTCLPFPWYCPELRRGEIKILLTIELAQFGRLDAEQGKWIVNIRRWNYRKYIHRHYGNWIGFASRQWEFPTRTQAMRAAEKWEALIDKRRTA